MQCQCQLFGFSKIGLVATSAASKPVPGILQCFWFGQPVELVDFDLLLNSRVDNVSCFYSFKVECIHVTRKAKADWAKITCRIYQDAEEKNDYTSKHEWKKDLKGIVQVRCLAQNSQLLSEHVFFFTDTTYTFLIWEFNITGSII